MQSTECIVTAPGDEQLEARLVWQKQAQLFRASVWLEIAPGAAMPQLNFLEEGPPFGSACQLHCVRLIQNFPRSPACLLDPMLFHV